MSSKPLESAVQAKIIARLRRNGWLVCKVLQTTLNGWPDLLAIKNGLTVYIEVKRKGEQPRPLQLLRHRQIIAAGGMVYVIDDENFTL